MAKVLILTLVFPPDGVSTAHVMGDLAQDLKSRGHEVSVVTTMPHYNRDVEAERRQPIEHHWTQVLGRSDYHGIPVYHAFMPRKGRSKVLRLLGWAGFHLIGTLAGMAAVPRPEVILAPSPPLTIGLSAWTLSRFWRAPYIYNVQEIYPDIAIRLGVVRARWLIRFLFQLEKRVYRKASRVTVIAPRMLKNLLRKGVPPDKVIVIPNFVDVADFCPLPKENDFSREHNLHDKFVVNYAGNLGPAQGLEGFIEAAARLQTQTHIHFVMMGDGILREALRSDVVRRQLPNFSFLPYQPYALMPQIYASADLCLVPQTAETGYDAVPSKVYRIMACARPVVAATDADSDLAHLVEEASCGAVVQPGDAQQLADVVLRAYQDRDSWLRKGLAGREHVVMHYSRSSVTERYHSLVESLVLSHAGSAVR